MNLLVKELIQPLLEEVKTIALYPGKFKPPHKGHFDVAKSLLGKADEIRIIISPVPVDGITPKQSESVWNLYNSLLDNKLNIIIADKSPVKYTLDTIKNTPDTKFITVFGKGEFDRYKSLTSNPNVEIYDGGTVEELNARDFRQALETNQNITRFLPDGISERDFIKAFTIGTIEEMSQSSLQSVEDYADKELAPLDIDFSRHFFDRLNDPRNIKPITQAELIGFFKRLSRKKNDLINFLDQYKQIVTTDNRTNINIPLVQMANKAIAKTIMRKKDFYTGDPKLELNENLEYQPTDFKQALASLTKYMVDQDLNVKPLPKLKIINNDIENAENILGKTAYYSPADCSITLYTLNRHPKDVLRSYAHEMIHRIQDNEGRLNNVNTTNTNEDSDLQELEKEAYLNGNITLRNWEDSIKNQKYIKEYKEYALNELFEKDLPNIKKISSYEYKVGNGKDIEALYYFNLEDPKGNWSIHWKFTDNNKNTSPEAWKQITASSYKILDDFIKSRHPRSITISGNTDTKTKIYKSKSYLEKLENIFNNEYKIDNSPEYSVIMKSIEETAKSNIQKRMITLNESYEQALNYWQNGDLNSNSKIERWNTIKRKVKREVLQELYNIK